MRLTMTPKVVALSLALLVACSSTDAHIAATGSPAPTASVASPVPETRPNILLIVADDQRASGTFGVMPRTRKLFIERGTRFTNVFASTPTCCPSRASILTGRYTHNHDVKTNRNVSPLRERQRKTLQHELDEAGYRTAELGKFFNVWPLRDDPRFFDRWTFMRGGYYGMRVNVNGDIRRIRRYSTDFIAERTRRFLDLFEENDADPWFIHVNVFAPHVPYVAERKYRDARVPRWQPNPAVRERDRSDKPRFVRKSVVDLDESRWLRRSQLRTLMSVDDLVARVFAKMGALDETRDTLAIYTSDHGYLWGEHGRYWKRTPYTPSVKMPFVMRWPARVDEGAVDPRLAANVDLTPTILDAAGLLDTASYVVDGKSLLREDVRDRVLLRYWHERGHGFPSWASLRTHDYQYVEYYGDGVDDMIAAEYYDLKADPWQLRNLLGDNDRSNDPPLKEIKAQLRRDMRCRGTECP